MKKLLLLITLFSIISSCKEKKATPTHSEKITTLLAEKYGVDNFEKLDKVAFTFHVKKGGKEIARQWDWHPNTTQITAVINQDTFSYFQNNMDSIDMQYDAKFVNDSYWLLFPFHLKWDDDSFSFKYGEGVAPISGKKLKKLTITYKNEGGYTPGDRYDAYLNDSLYIVEWSYFKGGKPDRSLHVTWEKNITEKNITVATFHQNKENTFNLWFDHVKFE